MSWYLDLLEAVYPTVLSGLKGLADSQVDGATLSKDQLRGLYAGYVVIKTNLASLAGSTANPFDDLTLEALADFAKDTLAEAGITVPDIPTELQ